MNIFSDYYQDNYWRDDESVSGHGSTLAATARIRRELPVVLAELGVKTMLDIPCGDLNWIFEAELDLDYIGADVVPVLIEKNQILYPETDFRVLDITKDALPKVDLVLCRDLLGHFSNWDVKLAVQNLKRSGSTFLLATTFPDHQTFGDILTGQWRPINLASYFGLGEQLLLLNEGCTEGKGAFADKSLGLWKLNEEF